MGKKLFVISNQIGDCFLYYQIHVIRVETVKSDKTKSYKYTF